MQRYRTMPIQQDEASKKDTEPQLHTSRNHPVASLPKHRIKGSIRQKQDSDFPPAPHFAAPESHQSGSEQFNKATEVRIGTATSAIGSSRFTLNGFTYYFTFFSKFFSSFPHGTCSLSVFGEYLALEGIYLPLCAAVPSNTTLSTGPITRVSHLQ